MAGYRHFAKPVHVLVVLITFVVVATITVDVGVAQRPEPKVHGAFDGDTMYTVLPPGMIPAIMDPEFVTGEEAAEQMSPDEMIMGIMLGGETRAYSLWHLDAHEIVNDTIAGVPIAATW
jgi:hypothetical protein